MELIIVVFALFIFELFLCTKKGKENGSKYDSYIGRLPAWHNLGTVTGEYLTVEKIFADGGLDFLVEKRQLEYSGNPVDAWGIFRTDNEAFLGSVGSEY